VNTDGYAFELDFMLTDPIDFLDMRPDQGAA
jgi:hypothetical protein